MINESGLPRWFGKMFRNELVNMPENEQRRISQIMVDMTKRGALQECLVPGNHGGKIVEGHNIQDAVMRKLTQGPEVMSFSIYPIHPERKFPDNTPISHATTGYFTCCEHEKMFEDVENQVPDFNNKRHCLLLAYKALLKVTWENMTLRIAWEAMEAEDPQSDMPNFMVDRHRKMEDGVRYYKHIAETMLGISQHPSPYDSVPDTLDHLVLKVPSNTPAIAGSCWSDGIGWKLVPTPYGFPKIQRIPQWGCTVYPLEKQHMIVYHYPLLDKRPFTKHTRPLQKVEGTILQRKVSQDLLRHFEEIVISPEIWESFSDEKKNAIEEFFKATVSNQGYHSPLSPALKPPSGKRLRLVNLFNGIQVSGN